MNSTDIKDYKASLIASKQERPKSCEELFERWKKEMEFPREEDFSRDETVAAAVEKLQKKNSYKISTKNLYLIPGNQ